MAHTMAVKRCVKYNCVDVFALLSFIFLLVTKAEASPRPCQPNLRGCAELKAQKQFTVKDPHTMPLQYLSGDFDRYQTTKVAFQSNLVQYFSVSSLNSLNQLDWMKKNILRIFQKKLAGSPVFPISVQFRNRLW